MDLVIVFEVKQLAIDLYTNIIRQIQCVKSSQIRQYVNSMLNINSASRLEINSGRR